MSDFNSALPVRTQNNGDVAAKIVDGTLSSQALSVDAAGKIPAKLSDGAGNAITSQVNGTQQALDVGINVAGIQIDPRQVRALAFATDKVDASGSVIALDSATLAALESITVQNGAGAAAVNIQDGGNSITVDGTVSVSNLPATTDTNYGTVGANTIRTAAQLGNATGAADFDNGATGAQTIRVAANMAIAGANVSSSNPVPVTIVDVISGAVEVLDFKQAISVAAAASDTHTYGVTAGKTLHLQKITAAASGKMKCEISINGALKIVKFNSTANPNIEYEFVSPQNLAAALVVDVVLTNLDLQAQNLYSTIEGYEV